MLNRAALLAIAGMLVAISAEAHDLPTHEIPAAPTGFLGLKNPLAAEEADATLLKRAARGYKSKCKKCHGAEGDGHGPRAGELSTHPAVFSSPGYMASRSDGQLFWIIANGSPGTEMPAHGPGSRFNLPEEEIWALILHLRANFTK